MQLAEEGQEDYTLNLIKKHPWVWSTLSFITLTFPQWFASVWSLFFNQPAFQFLQKRFGHLTISKFSPYFITIPLGVLMFVTLILVLKRRDQEGGKEEVHSAPDTKYLTAYEVIHHIADKSEWSNLKNTERTFDGGRHNLLLEAPIEFQREANEGNMTILGRLEDSGSHQPIPDTYWLTAGLDLSCLFNPETQSRTTPTVSSGKNIVIYTDLKIMAKDVYQTWPPTKLFSNVSQQEIPNIDGIKELADEFKRSRWEKEISRFQGQLKTLLARSPLLIETQEDGVPFLHIGEEEGAGLTRCRRQLVRLKIQNVGSRSIDGVNVYLNKIAPLPTELKAELPIKLFFIDNEKNTPLSPGERRIVNVASYAPYYSNCYLEIETQGTTKPKLYVGSEVEYVFEIKVTGNDVLPNLKRFKIKVPDGSQFVGSKTESAILMDHDPDMAKLL